LHGSWDWPGRVQVLSHDSETAHVAETSSVFG
jgi:hypothetical protein